MNSPTKREWFPARHTTQDDEWYEVICINAAFCVTFNSVVQAQAVADLLNAMEKLLCNSPTAAPKR